jgi:DNA-binding XRE family transcriptional regulator
VNLTRGEALWLARRRARATQATLAWQYGVSEVRYRRWERDRGAGPLVCWGPTALSSAEYAALARRRAGLTLEEMSALTGLSRVALNRAERGHTSSAPFVRDLYDAVLGGMPKALAAAPVKIRVNGS